MLNSIPQQIELIIPTQKFILIDNHLLIPLISINARQIFNFLQTTVNKFKNFIETSLEL